MNSHTSLVYEAGPNRRENGGAEGRVTCLRSQRVSGPGLKLGLADAKTLGDD